MQTGEAVDYDCMAVLLPYLSAAVFGYSVIFENSGKYIDI